jgi:hypothetical protein
MPEASVFSRAGAMAFASGRGGHGPEAARAWREHGAEAARAWREHGAEAARAWRERKADIRHSGTVRTKV